MTLVGVLLAVVALYFGREIFIPLAGLVAELRAGPPVLWLRRWRLARVPAVILVVAVAFIAIVSFAAVVTSQVGSLAKNMPEYQRNLQSKLRSIQGSEAADGLIERAMGMLRTLRDEVAVTQEAAPESGARLITSS